MELDRRRFLSGAASMSAVAALPLSIQRALAINPAGSSLSAVKHIVIFMQENRSFDHYFGAMKGVRGFSDKVPLFLPNGNTVFQQPNGAAAVMPFHLDTTKTRAQCISGLDHSWSGGHSAWAKGKCNNWIAAKSKMTMGYFTRADIPFHYALADAFTICDHYYSSVMGPTNPNRLYLWTGMIDPNSTGGGPAINNNDPGFSWTTYPERLQNAGVSWRVYQNANDNYTDNSLAWFKNFKNAPQGSVLQTRGMGSVPKVTGNTVDDIAAALKSDVLNNTLPQVSWVVGPESASEHPSHSPAAGADMISKVLNALTANPDVWASTILLLNYDENDGFFDHAIAPIPPAGTAGEFVGGLPIGLGPRVPMTIISPWSTGGYVCSQVFDHTSVIRLLEVWTGVQEPNISVWRRKVCGDLTSAFNFSATTVSVPAMPNTASLASQANTQCSTLPAPSAPATQTMPVQEVGTKPARSLPYQPNATSRIDKAAGKFWITMTNTGTEAFHYAIFANNFRTDGPWHYDVTAGSSVQDYFNVQAYGGGSYDLSVYGANGFLRRFIGSLNAVGAGLEVSSSYDLSRAGQARIVLSMVNNTTSAVTFTVKANNYRTDGPWTYTLPAGTTSSDYWNAELYGNCWYDLFVTASSDSAFYRRFAGHIETGKASITG